MKQKQKPKSENRYFTETGCDITERIESGTTKFFEYRNDAQKQADLKRSYSFPVFNRTEQIGYGVTG